MPQLSLRLQSLQHPCAAEQVGFHQAYRVDAACMQAIPGLDGAQSLSDLAGQIPNIVSNFLGYSVIPQVLSQNQLANGAMFNTTSRLKQGNSVNGVPTLQALSFRTSGGMTQVTPCFVSCFGCEDTQPCIAYIDGKDEAIAVRRRLWIWNVHIVWQACSCFS